MPKPPLGHPSFLHGAQGSLAPFQHPRLLRTPLSRQAAEPIVVPRGLS